MAHESKLDQVSDSLHMAMPVTATDKAAMSTVVCNRLHNILQNSAIYFTFPACRTSRFSHSLGVMHLAGEMFRQAIINAERKDVREFFAEARKEMPDLRDSELFTRMARDRFGVDGRFPDVPFDPVYARAIPSFLEADEQRIFTVLFQAVRLYGFLHDLAHPPFSHVTENALKELVTTVQRLETRTKRQARFLETMSDALGGRQLHESMSGYLMEEVFQKISSNVESNVGVFRMFVGAVVIRILDRKLPVLGVLHELVDGEIDADRLDFTARDLTSTGLGKPAAFDRLVNTFTLCKHSTGGFAMVPSVRSLYSIEMFFAGRFDFYRFGIYHHRVRKFDGLLKEAIKSIALSYLQSTEEPQKVDTLGNLLPSDISGLWVVSDPDLRNKAHEKVAALYSQWDDAWLLSILRKTYFSGVSDPVLKAQLEEILSNKKHYTPLFKRPECFHAVDAAFLAAAAHAEDLFTNTDPRLEALRAEVENARIREDDPTALPRQFALSGLARNNVKLSDNVAIQRAIARLYSASEKDLGIRHAFWVGKVVTSGIRNQMVLAESGLCHLNEVSNIQQALETDAKLFPPFFVFLLPKEGATLDLDAIRRELGRYLLQEYCK